MSEVRDLYRNFSHIKESFVLDEVSASNIVGLYVYAGTLEDYETQYELYFQDANNPILDKEQFLKEATSRPKFEMEDMFKTISFKGLERDKNGNWPGVSTVRVDIEKYPGKNQS